VPGPEEVWIPLVDEPIGQIVARVQAQRPEVARLVHSPRRILAFRTFTYIRVGIVLGRLLVDDELEPYDGSDEWVDRLLSEPRHRARIEAEVHAVASEIAADPAYADEEDLGPDEEARARFRDFARGVR
jgi:hypothetical protein